jgi:hypothetical protein
MTIIESTIAFLFRPKVDLEKIEFEKQRTRRLLRNITDPAEAVGECLIEQPTKNDHDTDTQREPRAATDGQ